MAGEYTAAEMMKGARAFLERYGRIEPEPAQIVVPAAHKVIPLQQLKPTCRRGRPAFAPAAPSGRSSPR